MTVPRWKAGGYDNTEERGLQDVLLNATRLEDAAITYSSIDVRDDETDESHEGRRVTREVTLLPPAPKLRTSYGTQGSLLAL